MTKGEKIRQELLALQERHPLLPRPVIHDWAEDHPGSAIHAELLWDDKKAGYQYRLVQISNMVSVYVVNMEGIKQMHALSIDYKTGGGYRHIDNILPNTNWRETLLNDAFEDFERYRKKYEQLKALAGVFAEMNKVKKRASKRKGKRSKAGGATLSAAQA